MLFLIQTIRKDLGYNQTYNVVVRADSEDQARKLASEEASFCYDEMWLDSGRTQCEVIDTEGEPAVICIDHLNA